MIQLCLNQVQVKFRRVPLFNPISIDLEGNSFHAITGPNGIGKSTVMRVIAGQLRPSEGQMGWRLNGQTLEPEQWFRHLAWSAPYIELPSELTLLEFLTQHFKMKKMLTGFSIDDIIETLGFQDDRNKPLRHFSSGMMQRVKTGTAIMTAVPVVLLDEPTANMDPKNTARMLELIQKFKGDRLIIIASNIPEEYALATSITEIMPVKANPASPASQSKAQI